MLLGEFSNLCREFAECVASRCRQLTLQCRQLTEPIAQFSEIAWARGTQAEARKYSFEIADACEHLSERFKMIVAHERGDSILPRPEQC